MATHLIQAIRGESNLVSRPQHLVFDYDIVDTEICHGERPLLGRHASEKDDDDLVSVLRYKCSERSCQGALIGKARKIYSVMKVITPGHMK